MGWVAGSKGWLAEEDSKRKTGKRKKEEDRERRVLLKGEDVRVGVFFLGSRGKRGGGLRERDTEETSRKVE